jgi:hypothetical protein
LETGSSSTISSSVIFPKNMLSLFIVFDPEAIVAYVKVLPSASRRYIADRYLLRIPAFIIK